MHHRIHSIAAPLFAVLGSQYERYGSAAEASPGTPCHVSGGGGGHEKKASGVTDVIDKAGMSAGLGLIAGQAKGELQGLKTIFDVSDIPLLDAKFRLKVRNQKRGNLVILVTPVILSEEED